MTHCPSCGGRLGVDCSNPEDCAWITQDQEYRAHQERQLREQAMDQRLELLESTVERLLAEMRSAHVLSPWAFDRIDSRA